MISPPGPAAELTALNPNGKGLRVRFYLDGDRYRHVVEAVVADRVTPLLESVEGSGEQPWPASPPFQNLQIRPLVGGGQTVLLTGAAGASHWSVAVEVDVDYSREPEPFEPVSEASRIVSQQQLLFDVACRVKSKSDWLGSTYRPVAEASVGCTSTFGMAAVDKVVLLVGPRLDLLNSQGETPRECFVREGRDEQGTSNLVVRPPHNQSFDPPTTVRWTYRMVLAAP